MREARRLWTLLACFENWIECIHGKPMAASLLKGLRETSPTCTESLGTVPSPLSAKPSGILGRSPVPSTPSSRR
ncbi:hypothetical protein GGR57DRAFT_479287 [Xylariaceae sp. FL1272]|nr:hypothetical protein GGR57DRAFT_479287 [Xylariaceae sp. FL1272]